MLPAKEALSLTKQSRETLEVEKQRAKTEEDKRIAEILFHELLDISDKIERYAKRGEEDLNHEISSHKYGMSTDNVVSRLIGKLTEEGYSVEPSKTYDRWILYVTWR